MNNLQMINELKKGIERLEKMSCILKKKNDNYYASENISKEENEFIYNNIMFFDSIKWDAKRLA